MQFLTENDLKYKSIQKKKKKEKKSLVRIQLKEYATKS